MVEQIYEVRGKGAVRGSSRRAVYKTEVWCSRNQPLESTMESWCTASFYDSNPWALVLPLAALATAGSGFTASGTVTGTNEPPGCPLLGLSHHGWNSLLGLLTEKGHAARRSSRKCDLTECSGLSL